MRSNESSISRIAFAIRRILRLPSAVRVRSESLLAPSRTGSVAKPCRRIKRFTESLPAWPRGEGKGEGTAFSSIGFFGHCVHQARLLAFCFAPRERGRSQLDLQPGFGALPPDE